MATKVTFKNCPKETGRAAVGNPYSDIDCKIKKQTFGLIVAPTWRTKDHKWAIQIMVKKAEPDGNPNCDWKWIGFTVRFDTPEQAKQWLQDNIEDIQQRFVLRFTGE